VQRAFAVVGNVGCFFVGPNDHFVRIFADGDSGEYLEGCSIDDRQRVGLLGYYQEGALGVGCYGDDCQEND
jgi:hypothetical protein